MKKFENIMDENQAFFNTEEPSEGHFERFEQKLRLQNNRIIFRRKLFTIGKVAAIIVLVVFTAVAIRYNVDTKSDYNTARIEKSSEMNEAEQFYSRMLELSYENIKQINFPNEAQKSRVLQEVSQKDDSYTKMKEDLQKDPSNEMAQQAMINYYETRLEVVNQIVANLNKKISASD